METQILFQLDPSSIMPKSGCQGCGREEIEKGCNGEGRIQGGIATVPRFGWWPIKACRPCPGFLASGGTILCSFFDKLARRRRRETLERNEQTGKANPKALKRAPPCLPKRATSRDHRTLIQETANGDRLLNINEIESDLKGDDVLTSDSSS
ncbi:unnamed protein product [Dovyalis caffra]|uniref:Uncharacterized protein n=1 Tax=Dovyalis caffra TaxID=77055 RepID=A0AAV1RXP8_9ROSI|nr:unnamed protein product [Dovyalis caffra]